MEQAPRTSFIPKQAPGLAPRRERRTFNVLSFLAMVVFLASLVLAVFVFFYGKYVDEQLYARKTELAEVKQSFSESDIASVRALERKLNAAQRLLDGHIALSSVFDALEAQTQSSAQLSSFDYALLSSGNAEVKLQGKAPTFNTVALQEQRFADERAFEQGSVIFSDLNIENTETGASTVTFGVSARLNHDAVAYVGVPTEETIEEVAPSEQVVIDATTTPEVTE